MGKRWFALALAAVMAATLLSGCSSKKEDVDPIGKTDSGKVRYLSSEPSQAGYWQELASRYTDETGVPVTVTTAEENQYDQRLSSEMNSDEAPSLFQIGSPAEWKDWKASCYDLSGAAAYRQLVSDSFALKDGDGAVRGIAYAVKTYGLICNRAVLQRAGYAQSSITSFATLKTVADDLQTRREELGIQGAFAAEGEKLPLYLANVALSYEFKNDAAAAGADAIKGAYLENLRQSFDLCITDAACARADFPAAGSAGAIGTFAAGKAAFLVAGTDVYQQIRALGDSDLGLLPLYIGAEGEEKQGLCTGAERYWCVNKDASEEDIQATLDFLNWVVTSAEGTSRLADSMGLVCPYRTAETPSNPLDEMARQSVADGGIPVNWYFSAMPSDNWRNGLRSAMNAYAAGSGTWDAVHAAFVDAWAAEYKLANS
ncbi:MAG: ABC transporter substrate-binding protein [Oscillibacter sp.]|jgi:raffinose/stachyose/melibiose transport system substrate-binding protein|nr:ABC transporter substrate-binding protein [Oscillibacter sp.]